MAPGQRGSVKPSYNFPRAQTGMEQSCRLQLLFAEGISRQAKLSPGTTLPESPWLCRRRARRFALPQPSEHRSSAALTPAPMHRPGTLSCAAPTRRRRAVLPPGALTSLPC